MLSPEITESLAARLGRPVVVFDTGLRLVEFSRHDGDVDPARISIILSRRGSARASKLIKESGVRHAEGPVVIPREPTTGSPPRVVFPVRRDGELLGYIVYVDPDAGDEPPGWQRRVLAEANGEFAELLARHRLGRPGGDQRRIDALLGELLRGDHQAGERLVGEGHLRASDRYTAMVLAGAPSDSSAETRARLEGCLAELLSLCAATACGTVLDDPVVQAVLVLPRPVKVELLAARLTGPVRAGVGDPRPTLDQIAEAAREAGTAARAAWLDPAYGALASWRDLGVDRLLLRLPLEHMTVRDLPTPVQLLLAEEDKGPDLWTTLDCYLDTGGDAQESARRLVIHRSSMYYRLDRIKKIINVDLADGRVRSELHVGLRVARLLGYGPVRVGSDGHGARAAPRAAQDR
ncbi:PucR family transcriptional regulator [Pseudonocardia acaciae]|uniref:PucR family transcriptional regulator n=1 Tax=Pseudonocardia acaciae TaxID=551276 RepID=UPI000688536A|nr:PucR family transcriptional regulator [Pseudonocardia acaciae]